MSTRKTVISSAILIASKFIIRLLGLISTLILARLLVPEDFGLVAMTMITLQLFDILGQTGSKQYIIKKEHLDDDDLNTAWTLDLILKSTLALLLIANSSLIASFYGDERLVMLLVLAPLTSIGTAFYNPILFLKEREQNYKPIFKLHVIAKVVGVIFTVGLAFYLRNYWALLLGQLSGILTFLILSYLFHSYRPSFTLKKYSEQIEFSKWMLAKGIFGYARSQLDTLLVNFKLGTSAVGNYHIMKYISSMPSTEVVVPAMEPLLATFSENQNNKNHLNYQFIICLFVISAISFPLATFMYTFHFEIVTVLLGEQWQEMSIIFGHLSLMIISTALGGLATRILVLKNFVKYLFWFDFASLLLMVAVLTHSGLKTVSDFTLAKVCVDMITLAPIFIYATLFVLNIPMLKIIRTTIPAILASISSMQFSYWVAISTGYLFVDLVILTLLFFCCFILLLLPLTGVFMYNMPEKDYFNKHVSNVKKTILQKINSA